LRKVSLHKNSHLRKARLHKNSPILLHDAICARLPHAGRMCLLDRLESWDNESIVCVAVSHRDPGNPLRSHECLPAVGGVEYAAQAMALHGSLLATPGASTARDGGRFGLLPSRGITPSLEGRSAGNAGADFRPPTIGYLASVRDLNLHVERLDDIAEDLRVEARRVGDSAQGFMYSFAIHAGARPLLAGRAMVKLMNAEALA
jgi:predicted hotdog family 3-hydroxylacyl-ACP dehydratase